MGRENQKTTTKKEILKSLEDREAVEFGTFKLR